MAAAAPVCDDDLIQPEKRLMLAVLIDAISIVVRPANSSRHLKILAETERWFASADTESTFSFVNICEFVGLDPGRVRVWLARERESRGTMRGLAPAATSAEDTLDSSLGGPTEMSASSVTRIPAGLRASIRLDVERWRGNLALSALAFA